MDRLGFIRLSEAFFFFSSSFFFRRAPHPAPTLVLLRGVIVVDGLAVPLAFAQLAGQVLLLLLVVMPQQLLPVIRVHVLLLLDDLALDLLDLNGTVLTGLSDSHARPTGVYGLLHNFHSDRS